MKNRSKQHQPTYEPSVAAMALDSNSKQTATTANQKSLAVDTEKTTPDNIIPFHFARFKMR